MTLERLNKHLALLGAMNRAVEIRRSLLDRAAPASPSLSGMPGHQGSGDKVGSLALEIADLDERMDLLAREISRSEREILPFIQGIEDNQTRIIFRLRFLRGFSWCQVADMIGGKNTDKSVSMICYRYLNMV